MKRVPPSRFAALLLIVTAAGSLAAAWPPEKFTNLKVLPEDIKQRELIDLMAGFTRALGVRCTYCHVGEEGKPLGTYDFPSDEKPTKAKAREMIKMVRELNEHTLAGLEHRADPPVRVECATCHRGVSLPRMLPDVMMQAYAAAGADSAVALYQALRARYYGGSAYDFGEVPLTEVANRLRGGGHPEDALRMLALNVEMNPASMFAKAQHAQVAISQAFAQSGADSGRSTYTDLRARYGPAATPEPLLIQLGYRFLGENRNDLAIGVFTLATETFPKSANAFDSLGEAQAKAGQKKDAIASYRKSLELDATNENAKVKLKALGAKP